MKKVEKSKEILINGKLMKENLVIRKVLNTLVLKGN
jgi:hypothetical protein